MLSAVLRGVLLFGVALMARAETAGISGVVRVTTTLTRKRISVPQVYERNVAIAAPAAGVSDVEAELRRVVVYVDSAKLASKPTRATMNQEQRRFEPGLPGTPFANSGVQNNFARRPKSVAPHCSSPVG